jgi:hypothetical protein
VVEHPGFLLGQDHHPSGSVGKPLEHPSLLLTAARCAAASHRRTPWLHEPWRLGLGSPTVSPTADATSRRTPSSRATPASGPGLVGLQK